MATSAAPRAPTQAADAAAAGRRLLAGGVVEVDLQGFSGVDGGAVAHRVPPARRSCAADGGATEEAGRAPTAEPPKGSGGAGRQTAGAPGRSLRFSEQADDPAGLDVDVDVDRGRALGQAGHGAHLAEQRVQVPGAGGGTDVADRHAEAARTALERRVVAQRQVGLGHAERQLVEALLGELLDLGLGLGQVVDAVGAVDCASRWSRSSL